MGDAIAANLFMLGYAFQKGRIPLTEQALLRAIELNGVAIASHQKSFLWGRRAAVDLKRVEAIAMPARAIVLQMPQSLEQLIETRGAFNVFGKSAGRKMERQLIVDYRAMIASLLGQLHAGNLALAIELAGLPEKIRGFGHVKQQAVAEFRVRQQGLLRELSRANKVKLQAA